MNIISKLLSSDNYKLILKRNLVPKKYRFNSKLDNDVFIKSLNQIKQNKVDKYANLDYRCSSVNELRMLIKKNSPSLYLTDEISKKLNMQQSIWFNRKCFDYRAIRLIDRVKDTSNVFDMSNKINQKNIRYLKKLPYSVVTIDEFKKITGIPKDVYDRYCRDGLLQKIQLDVIDSDLKASIPLIDLNDPKNVEIIERNKKLCAYDGKIRRGFAKVCSQMIYTRNPNEYLVDASELAKLGFSTKKELIQLIKENKIKGFARVVTREDGKKVWFAKVNMNDIQTISMLKQLREKKCIKLQDLSKKSGISITAFEDAIIDGRIDAINERVLMSDDNSIWIDVTLQKNNEEFDKLFLEKKLQEELVVNQKHDKKVILSLRNKIAWSLCPQTKSAIAYAFSKNDRLKEIQMVKAELIDERNNHSITPEMVAIIDDKLSKLKYEEEIEFKKVFKFMWSSVGTKEYKDALNEASGLIELYKTKGSSAITDPNILAIFRGCD